MVKGLLTFGIWSVVSAQIVQFQVRKRRKGGPLSSFRDAKMGDLRQTPDSFRELGGAADFGPECGGHRLVENHSTAPPPKSDTRPKPET